MLGVQHEVPMDMTYSSCNLLADFREGCHLHQATLKLFDSFEIPAGLSMRHPSLLQALQACRNLLSRHQWTWRCVQILIFGLAYESAWHVCLHYKNRKSYQDAFTLTKLLPFRTEDGQVACAVEAVMSRQGCVLTPQTKLFAACPELQAAVDGFDG